VAVHVDRLSLHVLHDEKVGVLVLADVVQEADPGMIERGNGFRLPSELLSQIGTPPGRHFDRDSPVQTRIPCAIDVPHSSRADPWTDFVRTDPPSLEIAGRCAAVGHCGSFEKGARPEIGVHQRLHFLPQRRVVRTGVRQEHASAGRR
jgi:hypothetical protein